MQPLVFDNTGTPSIAILIKESSLKSASIREYYVNPLISIGVPETELVGYPLAYPPNNAKPSAKLINEYLDLLLPELRDAGITTLYTCDAEYFKKLTGQTKAEVHLGYVLPCSKKGFEYFKVVLGSSYTSIFHNPATQDKITSANHVIASFHKGMYVPPGTDLFKKIELVSDLHRIDSLLAYLHTLPAITADIEGLSLHVRDCGISTIAFAQDTELAWSFAVDTHLGLGKPVREKLKIFFETYQGRIIWHNAKFDLKMLIYNLWMKHPLDMHGMYEGIKVMTRTFECTNLIAYLALNSCVRVSYSLKALAHEFAGNYAEQDIKDISLIAPEQLLKYNCVDVMATWYVYNKYYQKMIDDNQLDLYEGLFKDSVKFLLEMELTGTPINMDKVLYAEKELEALKTVHSNVLKSSSIIKSFTHEVQKSAMEAKQATLKKKVVTMADFAHIEFNPGSPQQLQKLLYETLSLPIIDFTKKKQPATGNKTLSKLKKHTQDPQILEMLDALIELTKIVKILDAFIPTFKKAWLKSDGSYYLHGNFNIGKIVSGRLSCSEPNLQQLPSGSTYGKLIKDCFMAATGWIMAGADFASLEDKINTLLTRDPNKEKVYTDGFDGHALRAFNYWKDAFPLIRQATNNERCFRVNINGKIVNCKSGDFIINSDGTKIAIENYYATIKKL